MPSAVANALFQRLLDAFPPAHALPPAAFEREPMPPAVSHFLTRLLRRRLDHELEHLDGPRSAWIDTDHADVQRAQEAFRAALAGHGQIPATEWEPALRRAVQEVADYLVRPVATLTAFVFQDAEQAIPSEVVDRRMGYFQDYAYLRESVRMYLEQKRLHEIDRARFADLLHHIDRQIARDYDADAWLRLLHPVFDLARRAAPGAAGVPTALLKAFFHEKGNETMTHRLEQTQDLHGADMLDEAGLRRLFDVVETPFLAPPAPDPAEIAHPAAGALEQPSGPVPRWKQFQQGQAPPPVAAPPPRDLPRTPDVPREAVPRWKQFRPEAAAPNVAPASNVPASHTDAPVAPEPTPASAAATVVAPTMRLAALERAVLGETGPANRDLWVKHLFAASTDEYERVLLRLHGATGWPEASQIIAEEIFRKNQVNIYSDPAVLFTNAAEARFVNES